MSNNIHTIKKNQIYERKFKTKPKYRFQTQKLKKILNYFLKNKFLKSKKYK